MSACLRRLDDLLDWTVVLSYTRLGYSLRRRGWDPADLDVDLSGQVHLVTGANAGIGFAAAQGLAERGARVILVARGRAKGEAARGELIERTGNRGVFLELADLSSLEQTHALADRVLARFERLDCIVNNAGVMRPTREVTPEGNELTFATNVLSAFALTERLLPLLYKSAPARVVLVSSGGMYAAKLDAGDLQTEGKEYRPASVYAQTKRAQVILAELWAEKHAGSGVVFHAMHPGWVDTATLRAALPRFYRFTKPFLRSPAQGADTIAWLAASDEALGSNGKFWLDRRPRPTHRMGSTRETPAARQKLWEACVRLSGLEDSALPD